MPLNPEDLAGEIDLSDTSIFEVKEIVTCKSPYKVTCKEAIDMLDRLLKYETYIKSAKKSLTLNINEFLDRP